MTRRLLGLGLLAVVAVACGGSQGPRSLDAAEYATVVVAADGEFWRDYDQATGQWRRVGASRVSARSVFATFSLLAGRYAATLAAVRPPDAVLASHDVYVTALDRVTGAFTEAAVAAPDVPFSEVFDADGDLEEEVAAANQALLEACNDLQSALGAAGQSVSLRCAGFL